VLGQNGVFAAAANGAEWRFVGKFEGPSDFVDDCMEDIRAASDAVLVVLLFAGDANGGEKDEFSDMFLG